MVICAPYAEPELEGNWGAEDDPARGSERADCGTDLGLGQAGEYARVGQVDGLLHYALPPQACSAASKSNRPSSLKNSKASSRRLERTISSREVLTVSRSVVVPSISAAKLAMSLSMSIDVLVIATKISIFCGSDISFGGILLLVGHQCDFSGCGRPGPAPASFPSSARLSARMCSSSVARLRCPVPPEGRLRREPRAGRALTVLEVVVGCRKHPRSVGVQLVSC